MSDLYYDKVALLLPMKGANGGTVFSDGGWSEADRTLTLVLRGVDPRPARCFPDRSQP